MGATMSPMISMVPFMLPMKLSERASTGTSFATGFPLFVITTCLRFC